MRTKGFSFVISSGVKTSSTCMSTPVEANSITTREYEVMRAMFSALPKTDELIETLLDHQNTLRDQ